MPVKGQHYTDITNPLPRVLFAPNDYKRCECCKRTKTNKKKTYLTVCKRGDTGQHEHGSLESLHSPSLPPRPARPGSRRGFPKLFPINTPLLSSRKKHVKSYPTVPGAGAPLLVRLQSSQYREMGITDTHR